MKSSQVSSTPQNGTSFVGSRQFKPQQSSLAASVRRSKMEGFDVQPSSVSINNAASSALRDSKRLRSSTPAESSNLKKGSLALNIEEQYIKGLQDEAKLLEYELKLLKDKETEEQTNFTSFFKYFNDGVPINDNIIAMKNVFSSTQRHLSEKLQANTQELEEVQASNLAYEKEISDCEERLKELNEIIQKKQDNYSKEFSKLENMYFNEYYTAKVLEPEQKELQKKTRFYQGELMVFTRNKDKELMIAGRKEAMDTQALEKIKKSVKEIEELILQKQKEVDDRINTDAFEHERLFLEEQNEILKKRILGVKNELSQSTVKIAEQQFILENQAKDRAHEVSQRLALTNKIFDLKELIEDQVGVEKSLIAQLSQAGSLEQQKMTEGLVQAKVKELERDRVRAVELEIEHIQKRQINLIQDRNDELEKINDDIIYNKVELEKDLIDLENEDEVLQKKLREAKEHLHELKVDTDMAMLKEKELEEKIEPLQARVELLSKENPKRDAKVQDLEHQIFRFEQQLDLINQFNNFNFEEAKMAYASNNQINKSIEKLVREYRKISSNN